MAITLDDLSDDWVKKESSTGMRGIPTLTMSFTPKNAEGVTSRSDIIFNKLSAEELNLKVKDRVAFQFIKKQGHPNGVIMSGALKSFDESFVFYLKKQGETAVGITNRALVTQMINHFNVTAKDFNEKQIVKLKLKWQNIGKKAGVDYWLITRI